MWGTLDCGEVTVTLYLSPDSGASAKSVSEQSNQELKNAGDMGGGAEDGDP